MSYQKLLQSVDDLDSTPVLFDGSASLVKSGLLDLIREQLGEQPPERSEDSAKTKAVEQKRESVKAEEEAIKIAPRLRRVTLRVGPTGIAKTGNLQPYLFKVLQEYDAGAEVNIVIEVVSQAGIPEDVLERRIVEGFEQLGVSIKWEAL